MIWQAIGVATALGLLAGVRAMNEPQAAPVATPQQPPVAIRSQSPVAQDPNPFNNLTFTPSRIDSTVVVQPNLSPPIPQWTVECGIKVMVVNPDIDPKMIVMPQAGAPEAKIRRISPPPCSRERSARSEPAVVEVYKGGVRVR